MYYVVYVIILYGISIYGVIQRQHIRDNDYIDIINYVII